MDTTDYTKRKILTAAALSGLSIAFIMTRILFLVLNCGEELNLALLSRALLKQVIVVVITFCLVEFFLMFKEFNVMLILTGFVMIGMMIAYKGFNISFAYNIYIISMMILALMFWESCFRYLEEGKHTVKEYIVVLISVCAVSAFFFYWVMKLRYPYVAIYSMVYVGSVSIILLHRKIIASQKYRFLTVAIFWCLITGAVIKFLVDNSWDISYRINTMLHPENSRYYGKDFVAVKELWDSVGLTGATPGMGAIYDVQDYMQNLTSKPMLSFAYYGGYLAVIGYMILVILFAVMLTVGMRYIYKNKREDGKMLYVAIYLFFMIRLLTSTLGCICPIINVCAPYSTNILFMPDVILFGIFLHGIFADNIELADSFLHILKVDVVEEDSHEEE
ncbi:MAG: hypothetical protein EOM40_18185 [Clostridia bacterium]|nr:hypothetical protein [Clostridia bacterium]